MMNTSHLTAKTRYKTHAMNTTVHSSPGVHTRVGTLALQSGFPLHAAPREVADQHLTRAIEKRDQPLELADAPRAACATRGLADLRAEPDHVRDAAGTGSHVVRL